MQLNLEVLKAYLKCYALKLMRQRRQLTNKFPKLFDTHRNNLSAI